MNSGTNACKLCIFACLLKDSMLNFSFQRKIGLVKFSFFLDYLHLDGI